MNRAKRRQLRKLNLDTVRKNTVSKIMQQKPTKGFGLTVTNNRVAILCWNRVLTIWERTA